MKIDEEQKRIIEQKLFPFFEKKSCGICSGKDWLFSETIFEMREFEKGNFIIGGKSSIFPVLAVTCKSCGNVYFFNAISVELINKENGEQK